VPIIDQQDHVPFDTTVQAGQPDYCANMALRHPTGGLAVTTNGIALLVTHTYTQIHRETNRKSG